MPKKIMLLNGHPAETSLNAALADAYQSGARAAGHDLRRHDLHALSFNDDFAAFGYGAEDPLEPDLKALMQDLAWSDHLVLTTPLWWGGMPARLKGLFDRAFLPGNSFDPRNKRMGLPRPLLTGRTARVLMTADTPAWAMRAVYGRAIQKQMSRQILGFVGIKPTRFSHFAPVELATDATIAGWVAKVSALGRNGT